MINAVIFLVVLLLAGCSHSPDLSVELDDIREATFRYQFEHAAAVGERRQQVRFLSFGETRKNQDIDPSDTFIARFSRDKPRVAKQSQAISSRHEWVTDLTSGEPGVIFYITSVRKLSSGTAEVTGGYHQDRRSASGNTYRLERRWGKWKVVDDRMDWISLNTKPNKAPEPTPGLVTSRAVLVSEMVSSGKARLAPSPVVAHL